ncbi:MAG: membrane protein insertion efficiency factor YidD [Candidatus Cloacimonadota bacterium]|nr:MAG: membrane protein insertion efficiency factor YidD [Candidatus Cloacimonadota bacterium]
MVNIFFGVFYLITVSQTEIMNDLTFITEVNPIYTNKGIEHDLSSFTFKQVSEIRLVSTGLVRIYQLYVSPQGPPSCNFTMTCSHFMTQSIRKYGIFHGILMTSDRLQRCIRAGRRYYPINPKTGRAIDYPVETYFLGNPKRYERKKE